MGLNTRSVQTWSATTYHTRRMGATRLSMVVNPTRQGGRNRSVR